MKPRTVIGHARIWEEEDEYSFKSEKDKFDWLGAMRVRKAK